MTKSETGRMGGKLGTMALTLMLGIGAMAATSITNANWRGLGEVAHNSGVVYAVAYDADGNLFIGGDFTSAGGVDCSRVAKWDGTKWRPLGAGVNGVVRALTFDSKGNLYVGGVFTAAGELDCQFVARWDGEKWNKLGTGVDGTVDTLVCDDKDNLYVGGSFVYAGGRVCNAVAKWTGIEWAPFGDGLNSRVFALAVDGEDNLYAGGNFTASGDKARSRVARWDSDTKQWEALGDGIDGLFVYALALNAAGDLFVGGEFTAAGGVACSRVAKWNGAQWSALGAGADGNVFALTCDDNGDLYAGGAFGEFGSVTCSRVAKWDGAQWAPLGTGTDNNAQALTIGPGNKLAVGGGFRRAGNADCNYIAQWDIANAVWAQLGTGALLNGAEVMAVATDRSGALYIGGYFESVVGATFSHIAKWTGGTWSALGSGVDEQVYALACDDDGALFVGGCFLTAGGVDCNYIAKWDGERWNAIGGGMNYYGYVRALACGDDGVLFAGGKFTTAGGVACSRVAKWDGAKWCPLGTGMNGEVFALALDGAGHLYAGGDFTTAGDTACARVAMWDGERWFPLADGLDGKVVALAFDSHGKLYAAGHFFNAGELECGHVAIWDPIGQSWSVPGDGVKDGGFVSSLVFDGEGSLCVGGNFANAGGAACSHIARWDGATWGPLGDGTNAEANALAWDAVGGNLFVGGRFQTAGDKTAPRIAKCDFLNLDFFVISANSGAGGLIVPSGAVYVDSGDDQSFVIAPDPGYAIADVRVDGVSVGAVSDYRFDNVKADHAIVVTFAPAHTVTFTAGANGTISGKLVQFVADGGSCDAVNAVPNSGYRFTGWSGDYVGTENPLTVKNVKKSMNVVANFAPDVATYKVTFIAGANGSIEGDTEQTVVDGGSCSAVTARPDVGYYFDRWTGTDTETADNPLTVKNVKKNMTLTANFVAQQVFRVAPGSTFTYQSATVLTKKPKVAVGKANVKVLNKASDFKAGVTALRCQWTNARTSPQTYTLTVNATEATKYFNVEAPILISTSTDTAAAGAKITVNGKYFGSAKPKVFMTYIDTKNGKEKKATCKLDKPSYADANGKAGKSYMDLKTGESKFAFVVPQKISANIEATLHIEFTFADAIVKTFNAD